MSGRLKRPLEIDVFLPKYLQEEKVVDESLEAQERKWAAFRKKYHKVAKEAGLE